MSTCAIDNFSTVEQSSTSIQHTIGLNEDDKKTMNLNDSSGGQQLSKSPENLTLASISHVHCLKLPPPNFLSNPKSPVKSRYLSDLVIKNVEETNKDEGMASGTATKRKRTTYPVINRLQSDQGERKLVLIQVKN